MSQIKWYNITEYVNIETGEVVNFTKFKSLNWRKLSKTEKNEIKTETTGGLVQTYGIKTTIWECRENEQLRIEL